MSLVIESTPTLKTNLSPYLNNYFKGKYRRKNIVEVYQHLQNSCLSQFFCQDFIHGAENFKEGRTGVSSWLAVFISREKWI